MRSQNIDAHSAARIRLIIREAVRSRMGLLREGTESFVAEWKPDGTLSVKFDFTADFGKVLGVKDQQRRYEIASYASMSPATGESAWDFLTPEKAQVEIAKGYTFFVVQVLPRGPDATVIERIVSASEFPIAAPKESGAPAAGSADGSASPAVSSSDAVASPAEPHAVAGDVRDLARQGVRAVAKGFADDDEVASDTIKISDLADPPADHKWLTNGDRGQLSDWQAGDEYTYIALVNKDNDPVLFVVSGDPEDNNHHSTGYILAPDSRQSLHRKAFCILYKRATGKTHPSCMPRSGGGGVAGRGGRGGAGSSQGAGSGGAGATGSGSGGEGSRYVGTAPDIDTGGRSVRVRADGDRIRSGGGDAESVAGLNRNRERIFGRRFYSRSDMGFDRMGPDGTATPAALRKGGKKNGDVPKTIVVVFKYPVVIDPKAVATSADGTQTVSLANASLGNNRTADDITSIGFYYKTAADNLRALVSLGVPRSPRSWWRGKFTKEDDPEAFKAAADWIFANPQQFDLAEDIEFHGAKGSSEEKDKGISDTEQKAGGGGELGTGGASADAVAAFKAKQEKGEKLDESRRTPLLDRYRF